MKNLIFVLASLFSLSLLGQTVYTEDQVVLNNDSTLLLDLSNNRPINGIIVLKDEGDILTKEYYTNGKWYSTIDYYYPSGNIQWIHYYNMSISYSDSLGISPMLIKEYYENGGEVWTWYYQSGVLASQSAKQNGNYDGFSNEYYESGALECEMTYKDDKKEGIEKGYYESGALKYEMTFKDGQKEGVKKGYYESGARAYERNYMDEPTVELYISGIIRDEGSGSYLSDGEVVVFQDGVTFDILEVDILGKYSVELPLHHLYTFEFVRDGFTSKKVSLDVSDVPETDAVDGFGFDLDITLFKTIEGFDESILDTPIGMGTYDVETGKFNFDMDHTDRVKQRIENEKNRILSILENRINLNND